MSDAPVFRLKGKNPWQSMTFSGQRFLYSISPPAGQIIAEVKVADDGTVEIVVFDDWTRELTREPDPAEAERFRLECDRDARIPDEDL